MARTVASDALRALVQALADGGWHSGARLADSAGLTRAGLSKRIHGLAALGLDVATQPRRGYRLAQPLDLLDADVIVGALPPALRGRASVGVAFTTDSTNRRLMEADATRDPQALLAEHQSEGRGRRGRRWHSPLGANLYLSLAWTFAQWPPQLTALPLAIGVASARALQACGLRRLKLKWPNDLLVDGRKLGGILIEQRGEAGGSCRTVIGLGVNVSMRPAQADRALVSQPWISLDEALGEVLPSRNVLAAAILARWLELLDEFAGAGFAPWAHAWQKLDATDGKPVVVQDGAGEFTGVARGVDESGALQVDTGGALRRVLSGDVSLRLAPSGTP